MIKGIKFLSEHSYLNFARRIINFEVNLKIADWNRRLLQRKRGTPLENRITMFRRHRRTRTRLNRNRHFREHLTSSMIFPRARIVPIKWKTRTWRISRKYSLFNRKTARKTYRRDDIDVIIVEGMIEAVLLAFNIRDIEQSKSPEARKMKI